MVTFNEFAAIELRVAKIVDVEDLTAARKPMYKLKLDVGELGERILVAGIKPWYTKEELMGRLIIIIVNLEPKNIAGEVSQGMLLAADDGERAVLLQPDKDILPGSRIR